MYEKLIIACAAVLVLGLGLTTVGHVLGGQFYSVYYDGALHPFSDAAQNFSDKFVNISDHIVTADEDDDSDFDTDWVQDYLETRRNAIEHGDMLSSRSIKSITSTWRLMVENLLSRTVRTSPSAQALISQIRR